MLFNDNDSGGAAVAELPPAGSHGKAKRETTEVVVVSEAMAPLTHMSGTSGNEALVMRGPVMTPQGVRQLPRLSGNALRHRCVRDPGAEYLIGVLGLSGTLSLQEMNFLFHGGTLTEGGGVENTRRIVAVQTLFPLFRLLGGCLPNQILSGSMKSWEGMLVCEENRTHLNHRLKSAGVELDQKLRPAESFVSGYQYVRNDSRQNKRRHILPSPEAESDPPEGGEREKGSQMIFAGQQVMRGSMFVHGFLIEHGSELELGALLLSLDLWQKAGATVGGQSARGHGLLKSHVVGIDPERAKDAVAAYQSHTAINADGCRQWLRDAFAARPAKSDKAAKGKSKGKATAAPVADEDGGEGE